MRGKGSELGSKSRSAERHRRHSQDQLQDVANVHGGPPPESVNLSIDLRPWLAHLVH